MVFDPYHEMLDLKFVSSPPEPHELLLLPKDCQDTTAINLAARAQLKKLDQYALSPDHEKADTSQRLMNEVAQARNTMLEQIPSQAMIDTIEAPQASIPQTLSPDTSAGTQSTRPPSSKPKTQSLPASTLERNSKASSSRLLIMILMWTGIALSVLVLGSLVVGLTLYLGVERKPDITPASQQTQVPESDQHHDPATEITTPRLASIQEQWAQLQAFTQDATPKLALLKIDEFLARHPQHAKALSTRLEFATKIKQQELWAQFETQKDKEATLAVEALIELIQLSPGDTKPLQLWHEIRLRAPVTEAELAQQRKHLQNLESLKETNSLTEKEYRFAYKLLTADPRQLSTEEQGQLKFIWDWCEGLVELSAYQDMVARLRPEAVVPEPIVEKPEKKTPAPKRYFKDPPEKLSLKAKDLIVSLSERNLVLKHQPDHIDSDYFGKLVVVISDVELTIDLQSMTTSTRRIQLPARDYTHYSRIMWLNNKNRPYELWWKDSTDADRSKQDAMLVTPGAVPQLFSGERVVTDSERRRLFTITGNTYTRYALFDIKLSPPRSMQALPPEGKATDVIAAARYEIARVYASERGYEILLLEPGQGKQEVIPIPELIPSKHRVLKMGIVEQTREKHIFVLSVQNPDQSIQTYALNTKDSTFRIIADLPEFYCMNDSRYIAFPNQHEVAVMNARGLDIPIWLRFVMPENLPVDYPILHIRVDKVHWSLANRIIMASSKPDKNGHYRIHMPGANPSTAFGNFTRMRSVPDYVRKGTVTPIKAIQDIAPEPEPAKTPTPKVVQGSIKIPQGLERVFELITDEGIYFHQTPETMNLNNDGSLSFTYDREVWVYRHDQATAKSYRQPANHLYRMQINDAGHQVWRTDRDFFRDSRSGVQVMDGRRKLASFHRTPVALSGDANHLVTVAEGWYQYSHLGKNVKTTRVHQVRDPENMTSHIAYHNKHVVHLMKLTYRPRLHFISLDKKQTEIISLHPEIRSASAINSLKLALPYAIYHAKNEQDENWAYVTNLTTGNHFKIAKCYRIDLSQDYTELYLYGDRSETHAYLISELGVPQPIKYSIDGISLNYIMKNKRTRIMMNRSVVIDGDEFLNIDSTLNDQAINTPYSPQGRAQTVTTNNAVPIPSTYRPYLITCKPDEIRLKKIPRHIALDYRQRVLMAFDKMIIRYDPAIKRIDHLPLKIPEGYDFMKVDIRNNIRVYSAASKKNKLPLLYYSFDRRDYVSHKIDMDDYLVSSDGTSVSSNNQDLMTYSIYLSQPFKKKLDRRKTTGTQLELYMPANEKIHQLYKDRIGYKIVTHGHVSYSYPNQKNKRSTQYITRLPGNIRSNQSIIGLRLVELDRYKAPLGFIYTLQDHKNKIQHFYLKYGEQRSQSLALPDSFRQNFGNTHLSFIEGSQLTISPLAVLPELQKKTFDMPEGLAIHAYSISPDARTIIMNSHQKNTEGQYSIKIFHTSENPDLP